MVRLAYSTLRGTAYRGDSLELLASMANESIDLIVTSPPFPLLRQKAYGNQTQHEYVERLVAFGAAVQRTLKPTGSFVLDLGGTYQRGSPIRSLYQYRMLLQFCDQLG